MREAQHLSCYPHRTAPARQADVQSVRSMLEGNPVHKSKVQHAKTAIQVCMRPHAQADF